MGCTHPGWRELQLLLKVILLIATHLACPYARQAVALIQRGEAVLIRFQGCGPVPGEESLIPADPVVFGKLRQKIEGYVDVNIHVRIVLRPVQKACTLRDLVPHHAVFRLLIPVEKVEFVSGPLVVTFMQQRLRCHQTISSEGPGVLWTARTVRRPIAGDHSAAETRIARPGLLQRYLRPLDRTIRVSITRSDLYALPRAKALPVVNRRIVGHTQQRSVVACTSSS